MPAWKLVGLESRLGSSHQIAWTNDNELCPQAICILSRKSDVILMWLTSQAWIKKWYRTMNEQSNFEIPITAPFILEDRVF